MNGFGVSVLLLMAQAGAPVAQSVQLTIRERVIIRVPMRPAPPAAVQEWKEKKAERCMRLDQLAGAVPSGPSSVDFILRGGSRMRAKLENACPALDFYSGFYLQPSADGLVCAGREAIHSRAGGECTIVRFRRLVPKKGD